MTAATATADGGGEAIVPARHSRRRLFGAALTAVLALALVWPASAGAMLGFDPAGIATDVFAAIVKFILGDPTKVARKLVDGLVGLPLYASGNSKYAALREYQGYTTALAFGLVPLMFTIGAMRYWATGISQGSPYEALRIVGRSGIALCGVIAWVPAFDLLTRTFNELAVALLSGPGVGDAVGELFIEGLATTTLGQGGIEMLALIGAELAAFVLIIVKIFISALLAVLFVLGPIALALWPLEETAWLARSCLQSIFVLMLWPSLWAVCFAVFALLGSASFDSFGLGDMTSFVALAALIAAWKLPAIVARQALMAGVVPNVAPMRMMAAAPRFGSAFRGAGQPRGSGVARPAASAVRGG